MVYINRITDDADWSDNTNRITDDADYADNTDFLLETLLMRKAQMVQILEIAIAAQLLKCTKYKQRKSALSA
mgnify:FL=1